MPDINGSEEEQKKSNGKKRERLQKNEARAKDWRRQHAHPQLLAILTPPAPRVDTHDATEKKLQLYVLPLLWYSTMSCG